MVHQSNPAIHVQKRRKEMKSGEAKWRVPQNLINIHDFCGPKNCRIRMRTAQQLMQQWKPMVASRLTQIIDRFGYNTSDNGHGGATVELYGAYCDAYYW